MRTHRETHAAAITAVLAANAQDDASTKSLQELEDSLRQLIAGLSDVPAVNQRIGASEQKRDEIGKAREARIEGFHNAGLAAAEELFRNLPPTEVKTDADGRFKLPAKANTWLLARSSRNVVSSEES